MAERGSFTPTHGTNVRANKSQQWATRQILQLLWRGAPRLAERFAVSIRLIKLKEVPSWNPSRAF
jgi:hypothetical protein